MAHTKEYYPELWEELRELDKIKDKISPCFKYDKTLAEVEAAVNEILEEKYWSQQQMTIFDFLEE